MDQLKLLKHELTDMKNVYIEKQRESKSWDTKVQVLAEMKNEMKKKEGDSGDIVVLQKEIHRMRVKQKNNKSIGLFLRNYLTLNTHIKQLYLIIFFFYFFIKQNNINVF